MKKNLIILFACCAGVMLLPRGAAPASFFVDQSRGDDGNDGLAWTTAKATIQSAIDAASATSEPDDVSVAAGNYREGVAPCADLTLRGGYPPGGGGRDLAANPTVIDAEGKRAGVYMFDVSAVVIEGFTITNAGENGIWIHGGDLTLRDVAVRENQQTSKCFAGMVGPDCVPSYSAAMGAGLYASGSSLDIANCLFVNNMMEEEDFESLECVGYCFGISGRLLGVAMHLSNCVGVLENITVTANTFGVHHSGDMKHALIITGGNMLVSNSIVCNNDPAGDHEDYSGPEASFSDVCTGVTTGTGNISSDPLFATGPLGDYYLSQLASGQSVQSPCVDAGSGPASDLLMDTVTTRTDQAVDGGLVDLGYHYPLQQTNPTEGIVIYAVKAASLAVIQYSPQAGKEYDLIKGYVDAMADMGSHVDLGVVTCVRDGDTSGVIQDPVADPATSPPIFYLLRDGSTPGPYGTTSDGKELVPSSGGCP